MNYFQRILRIFFLLTVVWSAEPVVAALSVKVDGTPHSGRQIDFGEVLFGKSAVTEIRLTNQGTADLTVNGVSLAAAGQFKITGLPALPSLLAKGKSLSFRLVYASSHIGSASTLLSVKSNDSPSAQVLRLKGKAVTPGMELYQGASGPFSDGDAYEFSAPVYLNDTQKTTFTLKNDSAYDLHIQALRVPHSADPVFQIERAPTVVPAGGSKDFDLLFTPTTEGEQTTYLVVASDSQYSPLPLVIKGTGQKKAAPAIAVLLASTPMPGSGPFPMGSVYIGQTQTEQGLIRNTGNASLVITSATIAATTHFSATLPSAPTTIDPQKSVPFTVVFSPKAVGKQVGSLSIVSNDPQTPKIDFQVQGVGLEALKPAITVLGSNGAPIGRGGTVTVPGKGRGSYAFRIKNSGKAALTISSVTSTNGYEFSLPGGGRTIQPGAVSPFYSVTFNPRGSGLKRTTVNIAGNASFSFNIQGRGEDPQPKLLVWSLDRNRGNPYKSGDTAIVKFQYGSSYNQIIIQNVGNAPLQYLGASISPPGKFSIKFNTHRGAAQLLPNGGNSTSFDVRYSGQRWDRARATLTIRTADPKIGNFILYLQKQ